MQRKDVMTALEEAGVPVDLRLEIEKLYLRAGDYRRALAQLEVATTDFVLHGIKYMNELTEKEFGALLPALTEAYNLLKDKS
jgi:hypothetical protein